MKKALIIFLTIQFLSNHEAFGEMMKIPFLFQHYQSSENESFIHFLKEHYSDDEKGEPDHEHGKLPFKHSSDGCTNHPIPNISPVVESSAEEFFQHFPTYLQLFSDSGDSIPASYSGSIWQPPKLA